MSFFGVCFFILLLSLSGFVQPALSSIALDEARTIDANTACMVASEQISSRLRSEGFFAFTQMVDSDKVYPKGYAHQLTFVVFPVENSGRIISRDEWIDGEYYLLNGWDANNII